MTVQPLRRTLRCHTSPDTPMAHLVFPRRLKDRLSAYWSDIGGNMVVVTGVATLAIATASFAIDYGRKGSAETSLQRIANFGRCGCRQSCRRSGRSPGRGRAPPRDHRRTTSATPATTLLTQHSSAPGHRGHGGQRRGHAAGELRRDIDLDLQQLFIEQAEKPESRRASRSSVAVKAAKASISAS